MTAHLREVHVVWDPARKQWCIEEYAAGTPHPTAPSSREWRDWKWVAKWVAIGTAKNGSPAEFYDHNRTGQIIERRTYPRSSDPQRSIG